jgi:hypothetical protein
MMASLSNRIDKKGKSDESGSIAKKRGWDEIESIFNEKKKEVKERGDAQRKEASVPKSRHKNDDADCSESNGGVRIPKRNHAMNNGNSADWIDDGLGGRYNSEGYTGRIEDGMKIFKAHVLSKPNAGQTPACPFDCDCCYI